MAEVYVSVKAIFENEEAAKEATKKLKSALKGNEHDLNHALNSICPIEDFEAYKPLIVEWVQCKKSTMTLEAYTGRTDPPVWFSGSLCSLGANKVHIHEKWNEGGSNYYFLNGKRVKKKEYDGERIKTAHSDSLTKGRVVVRGTLVSYWPIGDIYENIGMEFRTDDGDTVYFKGTGKLTALIDDSLPKKSEFEAALERGKLNGEVVTFAKRPSKLDQMITRHNKRLCSAVAPLA